MKYIPPIFFIYFMFVFNLWKHYELLFDGYLIIKKHQIFDLFLYNGESDMLYVRLWRLYNIVDKWKFTQNTSFFESV